MALYLTKALDKVVPALKNSIPRKKFNTTAQSGSCIEAFNTSEEK
jgi:hypothetical protein